MLRRGSTGSHVEQVQFWLSGLAQFSSALPSVNVDGSYGAATQNAVRAFQSAYGLTADGVVGETTWNALYAAWVNAQSDIGGTAYPGAALRRGSRGSDVRLVQFWLRMAAENYSELSGVTVDGSYGASTASAVSAFQQYFGLAADGVVGRATWNKLKEVALAVANELVDANIAPGRFTVTTREGSSGTAVRAVQYYLRLLAAYYQDIPTVTVDGRFGAATKAAVIAWQRHAGLTADGVVGPLTWQSIYQSALTVMRSGPVARLALGEDLTLAEGESLSPGDTGTGVLALRHLLAFLSQWIPQILPVALTGGYDTEVENSVKSAQQTFGLPVTGLVSAADWDAFVAAGEALYAASPAAAAPAPDDVWPGYALTGGSAGPAVTQVQRWLNALGAVYCGRAFVAETGVLDAPTLQALESYQITVGLQPLGVVDDATWESLKAAAEPFLDQMEV